MRTNTGFEVNKIEDIESLDDLTTSEMLDIIEMLDQDNVSVMRENYMSFLKDAHDDFVVGKHTKFLVEKLDWFMGQDEKQYLVISMPPQHGKSMAITESFPAWYLLTRPKSRVGVVGYSTEFAKEKFGRSILDKLLLYAPRFGLTLNPQAKRPDSTYVAGHNGFFKTFGILGGITGTSLDLIVVDDPVKNRQDANSPTVRDRTWSEFRDSVVSRKQAKTKCIVIMTRWHEDDLAGRLIEQLPELCEVVNIPLEAEANDILGREEGDALFPEIGKDKQWLEQFKKMYLSKDGKKAWEALYQGKPTLEEGEMISVKDFKYYTPMELQRLYFPITVLSVDTAMTEGDDNDYTVCSLWGKYENRFYLLDIDRGRYNFPDMLRQIKMMHRQYQPSMTLIEAKAAGQPVIDVLTRELTGIIPVKPKDGKITRTQSILGAIESGCVYLPEQHPLLEDFLKECKNFPNSKHDDMVDSMTHALRKLLYDSAFMPQSYRRPDEFGVFNVTKKQKNGVSTGTLLGTNIGGLI